MKNKKIIIGGIIVLIIIAVIVLIATKKQPGVMTISVSTKNGVKDRKLEDESIVDIKKSEIIKKNTMTDKKTNNAIVEEITEVRYELTAKKKGKTTLTLEYDNYKNDETIKDIYDIEVDNKLKITINKR